MRLCILFVGCDLFMCGVGLTTGLAYVGDSVGFIHRLGCCCIRLLIIFLDCDLFIGDYEFGYRVCLYLRYCRFDFQAALYLFKAMDFTPKLQSICVKL